MKKETGRNGMKLSGLLPHTQGQVQRSI